MLHLGYGWIVVGLLLTALAAANMIPHSLALHAHTAGAMGTLTLGMMARVSLGHTGRMLEPATAIKLAFVLITLSSCVRVFWPVATAPGYPAAILASGLLWMAAFTLFVLVYTPILIQSRVDGKPG